MDLQSEISRLVARLRELEDRVSELEDGEVELLEDAIGFDNGHVVEDHDSDETEYVGGK